MYHRSGYLQWINGTCSNFGRFKGIVDTFADNRINMTGGISNKQPVIAAARQVKKPFIGCGWNKS